MLSTSSQNYPSSSTVLSFKEHAKHLLRNFQCKPLKSYPCYPTTYKVLRYMTTQYSFHKDLQILSACNYGSFSLNIFLGFFQLCVSANIWTFLPA